jgi:hypothetical protein
VWRTFGVPPYLSRAASPHSPTRCCTCLSKPNSRAVVSCSRPTGPRYCDEPELLPLLLSHGLVGRGRTTEVAVYPLGGANFKTRLGATKPAPRFSFLNRCFLLRPVFCGKRPVIFRSGEMALHVGSRSSSSKRNPITCSGAASARVLLVRAHLLVAYFLFQLIHGALLDEGARGAKSGCKNKFKRCRGFSIRATLCPDSFRSS